MGRHRGRGGIGGGEAPLAGSTKPGAKRGRDKQIGFLQTDWSEKARQEPGLVIGGLSRNSQDARVAGSV